jgi:hypothetical protein
MLAAIVQKTTGMKLIDYLRPRLFEPLGIENPVWQESPQGINLGGTGLNVTTEDIARFGQLYLAKGMWGDRRILPEAWVDEASAYQVSNGDDAESDWAQGYGYQFWRCRHNIYRGDGAFGQYCIVMPEQDAVLAITSGVDDMQQPMNLIWDILLPAIGEDALPDDTTAHDNLKKKLSDLAILPVHGEKSSPTAARVSGRTYTVEANELKIETISLNFAGSGCTVTIKTAMDEQTIACGDGVWQQGQTTLFNEPWVSEPKPIVTNGAWTTEDRFTMVVRLYETPFFYTLDYHFVEDELRVEMTVNVSFDASKTWLLVAHPQ